MARDIYHRDGLRGFYKGFGASLAVNAPSSAIWWGTYGYFREYFFTVAGVRERNRHQPSSRALEAVAGASAGIVSTILTNPMDVARTRLQVCVCARSVRMHVCVVCALCAWACMYCVCVYILFMQTNVYRCFIIYICTHAAQTHTRLLSCVCIVCVQPVMQTNVDRCFIIYTCTTQTCMNTRV
jgi:hypothetical protein